MWICADGGSKGNALCESRSIPTGAKAPFLLWTVTAGLKPRPFKAKMYAEVS
jgi:hypothetical protein